jgi:beta-galactosidase/beta-glucuronidase
VTLLTRWGRALDPAAVLPEYPRPQLVRESWLSLNGWWDYAITPIDAARPEQWQGQILVPFSPEAPLSGVGRILQPTEALWYRLVLPALPAGERVLLHIGASDRHTTVWVDDVQLGEHHDGFLPFTLELSHATAGQQLVIRVTDPTDTEPGARGKQRLRHGGIWYTPQSGIWQTVWLEGVPREFIEHLHIEPTTSSFRVRIDAPSGTARVRVLAAGTVVGEASVPVGELTEIPLSEVRLWSPADPFLYDLEVELGDDRVTSYAGLRTVGLETDASGAVHFTLNGERVLQAGLLDQGYWPDGLLTPPSDEAMVYDIDAALASGFTMLRKHIKVEPARWYYHCDRLGMLVWQDAVNGGGRYSPFTVTLPAVSPWPRLDDRRNRRLFARHDAADRAAFEQSLERMIRQLASSPSVIGWVPFNEGWGQFDSARIAERVRELDPTRPVDHASGWHDQRAGDVHSLHVYFRRFRVPSRRHRHDRALMLSEFGGFSLAIDGHRSTEREFGYKRFRDAASLTEAIAALWRTELAPAVEQGLAGFVYTQLTDVEDETNGLLTYDREVVKIDHETMRTLNDEVRAKGRP